MAGIKRGASELQVPRPNRSATLSSRETLGESPSAYSLRSRRFSLWPTTSKRLLRRLSAYVFEFFYGVKLALKSIRYSRWILVLTWNAIDLFRMSPLREWTHMPDASYGTLFLISSRMVAQLFWHHIGNSNSICSLILYPLPALIRHALVKVRYLLEVLLTVCFICVLFVSKA